MERIGPYSLVRLLARGGMGEVFLATLHREGGFAKRVAIKRMLPQLSRQPAFVEMFEREARLAAALQHRNIVQIYDFGQEPDGTLWLAMEYVHGVDLHTVLGSGLPGQPSPSPAPSPLPPGLVVEIGLACCQALDHAHRATDVHGAPLGMVHRDVSPHNVLLSYAGDVKLTDFGLAHRIGEEADSDPGLLKGKLAYMSPEQAEGLPLDGRSDLFSLGVVLLEAFSGRRAFAASDGNDAILRRVRAAEPLVPLSELGPRLPEPLVPVLARALACRRQDRFPDAKALHDALRDAAAAARLQVGEPPLGSWLAERFPDGRVAVIEPATAEPTEAAMAPIAVCEAAKARPTQPAAGSRRAAHRLVPLLLTVIALLAGLGYWFGTRTAGLHQVGPRGQPAAAVPGSETPAPAPDPPVVARGSRARTPLPAAALARSPDPVSAGPTLPGTPHPGSGVAMARLPASSAQPPGGSAVAPRRAMTAPASAAHRRKGTGTGVPGTSHPKPDLAAAAAAGTVSQPASAAAASAPAASSGPPAPSPAAPVAAPAAAASSPASDTASGPPDDEAGGSPAASPAPAPEPVTRVRLAAAGAAVLIRGKPVSGWLPLPDAGLFFRVDGRDGQRVRVRLQRRGPLVRANVDSLPWGKVELDGRPLGETPIADIPLRAGLRRLDVVDGQGAATHLTIEVDDGS